MDPDPDIIELKQDGNFVSMPEEDEEFPQNPTYKHYFQAFGISMPENQQEINMVKALKVMMSPAQLQQFESYSKTRFDFHVVRAIMHKVVKAPVDDVSVFLMCELAKGFVEDVMNAALDHKKAHKLTGPVTKDEILVALDKSEDSFYLRQPEESREASDEEFSDEPIEVQDASPEEFREGSPEEQEFTDQEAPPEEFNEEPLEEQPVVETFDECELGVMLEEHEIPFEEHNVVEVEVSMEEDTSIVESQTVEIENPSSPEIVIIEKPGDL